MTAPDWTRLLSLDTVRLLRAAEKSAALRRARVNRARHARQWHLSLTLAGSAQMRSLNRRYRGKDRPTDVLSFPSQDFFSAAGELGDLVLCLPVARAQARELGHDLRSECRVLLTHGLLHLLGFDHEAGIAAERRMRRLEKDILRQAFGITQDGLIARH